MPIDKVFTATDKAFTATQVFIQSAASRGALVPVGAPIDDTDLGFNLDLPYRQLSVFGRDIDNASPVARMPLFAYAVLGLSSESMHALGERFQQQMILVEPLGVVGTDHVGYASFDLWVLRHVKVATAVHKVLQDAGLFGGNAPRLTVQLLNLWVLPFKDPTIAFDAMREGQAGADFIVLRIDMDLVMLDRRQTWPPMPSMQTPNILDWRLSPGSFSMSGAVLVGENGCETLLPANLATQLVRFRQTVRTPALAKIAVPQDPQPHINPPPWPEPTGDVYLGYFIEYHSEWFPLGHSLGKISYSLPLAPGEKVQIAVVDWQRQDSASRTEVTGETEQLNNDTLRDRSISDAVNMVVQESQSGSSFMAGLGLSAGAGVPIGPVSLGVGAAGGLGGASASTSGVRSVAGNTSQQISDAFHQAASAMRELTRPFWFRARKPKRPVQRHGRWSTTTIATHSRSCTTRCCLISAY
jgi:hypothetical protein